MTDSPLMIKLKKLLALASNNPSEQEAMLAMEKAQKLAVENSIDIANIKAFDPTKSEDPIIKEEIESVQGRKRLAISSRFINWILNEHFNVHVILGGGRYYGRRVTLVGTKKDIEIAEYLYDYLNNLFLSLWRDYYNRNRGFIKLDDRQSYMHGLYRGLSDKLKLAKEKAEEDKFETIAQEQGGEKASAVKQTYALMRISDDKRLRAKVDEYYPHLRSAPRVNWKRHNIDAFQSGKIEGSRISLRKGLGNETTGLIN